MGDDIRAGDVVVRVSGRDHPMPIGTCARVIRVCMAVDDEDGSLGPSLDLRDWPHPCGWDYAWTADNFRKLDAAEDVFVKAMQELRPLETTREIHRCRDEVGL